MPGFTHHQPAMPTTFGNLMDAYAQAVKRDVKLCKFAIEYLDESPMGIAAGYGTSIPVDKEFMAKSLGFSKIQENGIDAVTNRGEHEALAIYAVANAMNHLSSLAETLIVLSMPQIGFVKLDDAFCTGSSIMPQKKNPDALEITKAKAAFAQSCLSGALSTCKASFFGYNRDSQYQKKYLVHCFAECALAPKMMAKIIETLEPDKEKMAAECGKHGIDSTAKVEGLVKSGKMKFRKAKQKVEKEIKAKPAKSE
jgi:argininosuccinate lyase